MLWRITIDGPSIALDEDMENWPTDHLAYTGNLITTAFTASYAQGEDYLRWVCQFRGGTLVGTFAPDFSTFEALETLAWGAPGADTTVTRTWKGRRR